MKLNMVIEQAMLSQAVGDALGEPFEFGTPSYADFTAVYHGIRQPQLYITDDTQMALFGLYALRDLAGWGITDPVAALYTIKKNYISWYYTQVAMPVAPNHPLFVPELLKMRAPGNTCMTALAKLANGVKVENDSMGNGAVMRSLPFVFAPYLLRVSLPRAVELAVGAGYLTHKHLASELAIRAYMHVGQCVLSDTLMGISPNVSKHIFEALKIFPGLNRDYNVNINTFTAVPALIKAFIAILAYEGDFERVAKYAIVHDGDSDTIAAIAMGLHGLAYPAPDELVRRVVEADIIRKVVNGTIGEGIGVRESVQKIQSGAAEGTEGHG